MNLLLDSHAFLWTLHDDPSLGPGVRRALADPRTTVALSVASVCEIAIKEAKGKLHLRRPLREIVARVEQERAFRLIPVSAAAALRAASLPNHHADPFDRLILAVALEEGLTVASRDRAFEAYGVPLVW